MPFCHPCIWDLIFQLWFRSQPSGTVLQRLDPIPVPLIALACAVLKCTLDEWATGSFEKAEFSQCNYHHIYIDHCANWQVFEQGLYKNCCHIIASNITDYCIKMSSIKVRMHQGGVEEETAAKIAHIIEYGGDYHLGGQDDEPPSDHEA